MNTSKPIKLAATIDDDQIHTFVIENLMNDCLFAENIVAFSDGRKHGNISLIIGTFHNNFQMLCF